MTFLLFSGWVMFRSDFFRNLITHFTLRRSVAKSEWGIHLRKYASLKNQKLQSGWLCLMVARSLIEHEDLDLSLDAVKKELAILLKSFDIVRSSVNTPFKSEILKVVSEVCRLHYDQFLRSEVEDLSLSLQKYGYLNKKLSQGLDCSNRTVIKLSTQTEKKNKQADCASCEERYMRNIQLLCGHFVHKDCLARRVNSQIFTCPHAGCNHRFIDHLLKYK